MCTALLHAQVRRRRDFPKGSSSLCTALFAFCSLVSSSDARLHFLSPWSALPRPPPLFLCRFAKVNELVRPRLDSLPSVILTCSAIISLHLVRAPEFSLRNYRSCVGHVGQNLRGPRGGCLTRVGPVGVSCVIKTTMCHPDQNGWTGPSHQVQEPGKASPPAPFPSPFSDLGSCPDTWFFHSRLCSVSYQTSFHKLLLL